MKEASMANISQPGQAEAPPRLDIISAGDWLALPNAHPHQKIVAGQFMVAPSTSRVSPTPLQICSS
jgi:hypothetical protein